MVLGVTSNKKIYLFHKDDILDASLLHPCKDAFLQKGVEFLFTSIIFFITELCYCQQVFMGDSLILTTPM